MRVAWLAALLLAGVAGAQAQAPSDFSGLKGKLQQVFSGALAQTTPLKARWLSLPPAFGAWTVALGPDGTPWAALTAPDGRSVAVWRPSEGKAWGPALDRGGATIERVTLAVDARGYPLVTLDGALRGWTGKAWAVEPLPEADWVPPFAWTAGPRLWSLAGAQATLRSALWTAPGWDPAWKRGPALLAPAGPFAVLESGPRTWAAFSDGRISVLERGQWRPLRPAADGLPVLGAFDGAVAALSGTGLGLGTPQGWQEFPVAGQAASRDSDLLFVYADAPSPRLEQYDGQDWRVALPLDTLAPGPTGAWKAAFLPPGAASKTGFLVLAHAGEPARLDVYDLP